MTGPCAAPFDIDALAGFHENGISLFFKPPEKRRERYAQRPRQRLQRC